MRARTAHAWIAIAALAMLVATGCSSRQQPQSIPEPPTESSGSQPSSESAQSESSGESTAQAAGEQQSADGGESGDGSEASASDSGTPGGQAGYSGVQTPEEQTAGLDRRLDESLREFDEKLTREQTELAEQREETLERVSASAAATVGSAGSGPAGSGASDPGQSGMSGGGNRLPAPPGTPDGSDDDIVARQLREAAETEDDPELRAKLWEEYRRYKTGEMTPEEPRESPEQGTGEGDHDGAEKDKA
jgi:hypothetical protein